jgi:hypothetical protein
MHNALRALAQSSHPEKEPVQIPPDVDWDAFPHIVPTPEDIEEQYAAHLAETQRLVHPECGGEE